MSVAPVKSASKGWVRSDVRLDSKTVIITGSNQGVGYETALDLAGRGAKVIMACRRMDRAKEARSEILKKHATANLLVKQLDLASLASVREFAKDINETEEHVNILINNAGIMGCPQWKTVDGFEMQLGTNHIGHFLLTNLLLDKIKESAPSRIIIVSSIAHSIGKMKWDDMMHEEKYKPLEVYAASKLANILHGLELNERLEGTGVTCCSLHPGIVSTNLADHAKKGEGYPWLQACLLSCCMPCFERTVYISPKEGAQTSIYCAIAPELEVVSGKYFDKCAAIEPSRRARNKEDAKILWNLTEAWISEKS